MFGKCSPNKFESISESLFRASPSHRNEVSEEIEESLMAENSNKLKSQSNSIKLKPFLVKSASRKTPGRNSATKENQKNLINNKLDKSDKNQSIEREFVNDTSVFKPAKKPLSQFSNKVELDIGQNIATFRENEQFLKLDHLITSQNILKLEIMESTKTELQNQRREIECLIGQKFDAFSSKIDRLANAFVQSSAENKRNFIDHQKALTFGKNEQLLSEFISNIKVNTFVHRTNLLEKPGVSLKNERKEQENKISTQIGELFLRAEVIKNLSLSKRPIHVAFEMKNNDFMIEEIEKDIFETLLSDSLEMFQISH